MSGNGIHHVTALSGPAGRNVDFYTRVLGLRLVKKTVNFDDPSTYHLYYGDGSGTPGTILTFFPIAHAGPGRVGIGETQETAFRVPRASMGWWTHRLVAEGVRHEALVQVFGEPVLRFRDPDGMMLALVGVAGAEAEPAFAEPAFADGVPAEHAVRGFHGVTLLLAEAGPTAAILEGVFGFRETGREGSAIRLESGAEDGGPKIGGAVTLRAVGQFLPGRAGAGSVHHIAFRAPGAALLSPRGAVLENGMPRFFRRLAEGVFDEADLRRRAHELADFVAAARAAYGIGAPVALGFSNGANIAAATMLLRPETFAGAVLLRPMLPFGQADVDLTGRPVLMLSGALDPIVPEASAAGLAALLARAGAAVEHRRLPAGHGLSQADVTLAQAWLGRASLPAAA